MSLLSNTKTLSMLAAFGAVLSIPAVSHADLGDATGTCAVPLTKTAADAAMTTLYGAFQKVDQAFNTPGDGLTVSAIESLGYYTDRTQVIALGPFVPVGPLGPGAMAAIGIQESAYLQQVFEGGLKAAYGSATTLHHHVPTVTVVWAANRRVNVNSSADVYDSGGNKVAIVKGLAQYYIPCDPKMVPTIDWIDFSMQVLAVPAN